MKRNLLTLEQIRSALHQANRVQRFGITICHTGEFLFKSTDQQKALLDDVRKDDVFKMAIPRLSDQVALELACYQEEINGHIDEIDLAFVSQSLGMVISREMITKMMRYI